MKEPVILSVPEGYEIDKEQSTERQIVLKKIEDEKVRNWEDYCKKMKGKASYFYHYNLGETVSSNFDHNPMLSEFEDKKDAEALAAFDKLLKLRKDWVGEWEPNWNDNTYKYQIITHRQQLSTISDMYSSHPMTFPTPEMRNEFLDCFKDLLEQAKSLL